MPFPGDENAQKKTAGNLGCQPFKGKLGMRQRLSMTTAAVGSTATATMKASAIATAETSAAASVRSFATAKSVPPTEPSALEAATTAEPFAAAEALVSAESIAAMPSAFATKLTTTAESVVVAVPTPTVETASAIVAATVVAEPRSYPNNQAVVEITRPVISVGCARVRRIVIVAVRTIGRGTDVPGADSHHHLGMGGGSGQEHEKSDRCHIL
jgi:hypothetical protein